MKSIFVVRQYLYQNDQHFARLDCEAVYSTFEAAHKFMLDELCWEEKGKASLEYFRNEIVEYPLNKHIQAGYLSKRVYLTTGELHVDYDKIEESKPASTSLSAKLTLGELVRIPPDYESPFSGFFSGGFGVIVDLPRSETNNDPESCHYDSYQFYYICENGMLICGYLDEADVTPLSEPLPGN